MPRSLAITRHCARAAAQVEGTTFNPDDGCVSGLPSPLDAALASVAEICAVCNEACIEYKAGAFKAVGAPTEAALVVLAEKMGTMDAAETARLAALRRADPTANPQVRCLLGCSPQAAGALPCLRPGCHPTQRKSV